MQLPSAPPCQNKSNQFNMSYLTNISENSYLCGLKYEITTPYDEFISSNISFELFAILDFIINSYIPFGLILTKRQFAFNMFTSYKTLCLLVPFNSDFLYKFNDVCIFINERKQLKTYLEIDSSSSFEILTNSFILKYLPKFKTIKELYLKTKLSGKHIPYRIDKMIKHFKEESNKVIEDYDSPF